MAWFRKILCKIGVHNWIPWQSRNGTCTKMRACQNCGVVQEEDNHNYKPVFVFDTGDAGIRCTKCKITHWHLHALD